jgi:hypothetical protein
MNIFSVGALYVCVGSFLALVFEYINLALPDQLDYGYGASGAIRWSMAMLIVVYPAFVFISKMLFNDYAKNPENRELKIRKWLVYFTLFAAALAIGGDLIALIYNFLEGNLDSRFLLKILTIFVVAGAVFYFYLKDLHDELSLNNRRVFVWGTSLIVLVTVGAGFFTTGSPFVARMQRFDERRINDLQIIQNEIISYWQRKNKLPTTLLDLKNDISGFRAPVDPKTKGDYLYKAKTNLSFDLCANFELEAESLEFTRYKMAMPYGGTFEQNWDHGTGEVCFERAIDPELYKIQPGF